MIYEKKPICLGDDIVKDFLFMATPKLDYDLESNSYHTIDDDLIYSIRFSDSDVEAIDIYVKKVYFNQPYTIVIWNDGTKTIVKCSKGCKYDKYTGLVTCFLKKFMGDCGFSKFKKIANGLIKDEE